MKRAQRRVAAGLLLLGALAGGAGTAGAAEKTEDYNLRYQTVLTGIDSPCTPEFDDITLVADWHTVAKYWVSDDGSWRYQGSNRSHLDGSAADGSRYGGTNQFRAQTRVADGVVETISDEKHMLVGRGQAPSFTLRMKVQVRWALDGSFTSYEVLKEGADCRA